GQTTVQSKFDFSSNSYAAKWSLAAVVVFRFDSLDWNRYKSGSFRLFKIPAVPIVIILDKSLDAIASMIRGILLDNVLFLSVFNALITTSQSFIECRRSALFNTLPSYIVNNGDLIFSFSRDLVKILT